MAADTTKTSIDLKTANEPMSQNVPECPTAANVNACEKSVTDDAGGLSVAQLTALEMMLSGASDSAIAKAVGVNRRTVYRWRFEDETFRAQLRLQREAMLGHAADRMRSMLDAALNALQRQLGNSYAPTSHRAARTLLALSRIGNVVAGAEPSRASRK